MSSAHSPTFPSLHLRHNSFSNPSVALPTSQFILQPFRCFTYVTAQSPTLISLLQRHRLFPYVTWRAAHASPPRWYPWDLFRSFKFCSDAKESGVRKATGSYRTYSILVKTAALFLSLRWKPCHRQNCNLGSCACSEGLALGQNTDDDDDTK